MYANVWNRPEFATATTPYVLHDYVSNLLTTTQITTTYTEIVQDYSLLVSKGLVSMPLSRDQPRPHVFVRSWAGRIYSCRNSADYDVAWLRPKPFWSF